MSRTSVSRKNRAPTQHRSSKPILTGGPTSTARRSTRPAARRRRGPEGGQRTPRHRDEPGPAAYLLYQRVHAARPSRSRLAGPGPVRAVVRALQPHPVQPALPVRLRPEPATTSRRCGPGAALTPGTRSTATPPAWRPPPARWARASATPSAWRWPPAASAACSTRTPSPARRPFDHFIYAIVRRRLHGGGRRRRGRRAWPGTSSWAT